MRTALAIAVPLGVFLTVVAWRLSQILSSDAIAMAVGMGFGVFSLIPTLWLVALSRRRDAEDYDLRYSMLANTDRVRLSGPGVQSGVYRLETPDTPMMQVIDCESNWRRPNEP